MVKSVSFDLVGLVLLILAVLLIVGVVPFTPAWVGVLFILTKCELKFTQTWR